MELWLIYAVPTETEPGNVDENEVVEKRPLDMVAGL